MEQPHFAMTLRPNAYVNGRWIVTQLCDLSNVRIRTIKAGTMPRAKRRLRVMFARTIAKMV